MKIPARILSSLCAATVGVGILASTASAQLIEDRQFKINNVTVERTSTAHVANCFEYANSLYSIIWNGKSFDCSFKGTADSKNMLYGLSDEERLITAEHTENFINKAPLGAAIRITNAPSSSSAFETDSISYGGKYGHNVIITAKDEDGFYCLEDWSKGSHTSYYTWEQFGNQYNNYTYYKYIKYPELTKPKKAKKAIKTQKKKYNKTAAVLHYSDDVISDGSPKESFADEFCFNSELMLSSTLLHKTAARFSTDYSSKLLKK